MTRKEAIRQTHQADVLRGLGFTADEAEQLRRISIRLHHWHERECGDGHGCIERDETTNKTYWLNAMTSRRYPIRDLETGARTRLARIITARNQRAVSAAPKPDTSAAYADAVTAAYVNVAAFVQTDPRGAALYILRPGDVPTGADPSAYYNRGICVY
jgi:hypothetical protein